MGLAPGKGYNVFAGRDASKALGKSSMKPEDLSADYSELTEWELKVLDDWLAYYTKVCLARSLFAISESPIRTPLPLATSIVIVLRPSAHLPSDEFINCV